MDFPFEIFAETSEDGTLMLRECVENAAESEFKCEMKEGEQGRVSFLLNSNPVCKREHVLKFLFLLPALPGKGEEAPARIKKVKLSPIKNCKQGARR